MDIAVPLREEEQTRHWILNGGRYTRHPYWVRDEDLLCYTDVLEKLDSIESCEERDELLMTESSGYWDGYTSLWWACWGAARSPTDDMMKLVKLLIERISSTNRRRFIHSVDDLHFYSVDVCRLLLDNYDGDLMRFTAETYSVEDRLSDLILDSIQETHEDIQQALVEFSTRDFESFRSFLSSGRLLVHRLTAWREESSLSSLLRRLSLQTRRLILTYKDTRGVTPVYLSRHTGGEIQVKKLPGGDYYHIVPDGDISPSLVRMFSYFCNEYSVTSGLNIFSYTMGDRPSTCIRHQVSMGTESSGDKNMILMISTKCVEDVISVELVNLENLIKDINLYNGYTCKVVLVQMILKSPPRDRPDIAQLNTKMSANDLPTDLSYWFILTCRDVNNFIMDVVSNTNSLLSMNQLLEFMRHKLQRHESVIYVSGLQYSCSIGVVSSLPPVKVTVVSRDDMYIGSWDDSSLSAQTHRAGNALVMLVNVFVKKIDELLDLKDILAMCASNDTLPKVIFVQFVLKDTSSFQFEPAKKNMTVKPFVLPTDCSMCFMSTTRNMRQMMSKDLTSQTHVMVQRRLSELRQKLATAQEVVYVSPVYISLGRRLILSSESDNVTDEPSPPPCKIPRLNPVFGSALVICMSAVRSCDHNWDMDWEGELNTAKYILERQLGLKVESHKDLCSREVLDKVKCFAARTKADNYSVIAIMSHGDENDKIVTRDKTLLSVQELVDVFNDCSDNPKIVLLQYCRGPNRYNKLPGTHEDELIKTLVRRRPKLEKHDEVSPRQIVIPPHNTFMVYSTSSDTRSERGLMFKCMKLELYGMWKHIKTVDVIEMMTDVAGSVRDKSLLYQHMETVDTLCKPLYLHLYPHGGPDEKELFDLSCDML